MIYLSLFYQLLKEKIMEGLNLIKEQNLGLERHVLYFDGREIDYSGVPKKIVKLHQKYIKEVGSYNLRNKI